MYTLRIDTIEASTYKHRASFRLKMAYFGYLLAWILHTQICIMDYDLIALMYHPKNEACGSVSPCHFLTYNVHTAIYDSGGILGNEE
jgi:hypothetical protein